MNWWQNALLIVNTILLGIICLVFICAVAVLLGEHG